MEAGYVISEDDFTILFQHNKGDIGPHGMETHRRREMGLWMVVSKDLLPTASEKQTPEEAGEL